MERKVKWKRRIPNLGRWKNSKSRQIEGIDYIRETINFPFDYHLYNSNTHTSSLLAYSTSQQPQWLHKKDELRIPHSRWRQLKSKSKPLKMLGTPSSYIPSISALSITITHQKPAETQMV